MLQGELSAILLTFIKLPIVIKFFVLSIFEWPFSQVLLYTGIYYQRIKGKTEYLTRNILYISNQHISKNLNILNLILSSTLGTLKNNNHPTKIFSNSVLRLGQDFWGTQVSLYLNFRGTFTNSGGHTKSFKFLPVKLSSYLEISVHFSFKFELDVDSFGLRRGVDDSKAGFKLGPDSREK